MLLSKYVRILELEDSVALYDTLTRTLIKLPASAIEGRDILDDIGQDNLKALEQLGFFVTDEQAKSRALSEIENPDKLFISVELNHTCNLRCPYCYQGNDKGAKLLSKDSMAALLSYVRLAHSARPFSQLYLKVLGGEPTLAWDLFMHLHLGMCSIAKELGVTYHLLVDTNGTRVDDLCTLEGASSYLFTVPLTHRAGHDQMRKHADGSGSYYEILANMNRLHQALPDARIVLRHNTDDKNIGFFAEYLEDIKGQLTFLPWVSLNYTANLNGDEFANGLSYRDFIDWMSADAVRALVDVGLPVLTSPPSSIEECQYRSLYSLKLFVDGTVGNCAMAHYEDCRPGIDGVCKALKMGASHPFFNRKLELGIALDEECMACESLFVCGATKKLPCIQAIDRGPCNHGKPHNINLESFLREYLAATEKGNGDLFVVFEGGEGYR